jgi:hypothetical protein
VQRGSPFTIESLQVDQYAAFRFSAAPNAAENPVPLNNAKRVSRVS